MDQPITNSLSLYRDDLLHLRRESAADGSWTLYHLEYLVLDNPAIVEYRETFERKSEALMALYEKVRLEEMDEAGQLDTEIESQIPPDDQRR